MTIPRILHQIWIDPTGLNLPLPADVQASSNRWRELHPHFRYRLWSLCEIRHVLQNVAGLNVWNSVSTLRLPAMQADVVRLALVYQYGGFWSDLKAEPRYSFLDYLVNTKVVFAEHWPTATRPDPTDYLCNSFFGAEARNKFILKCLRRAHQNISKRPRNMLVFEMTGGGLIQQVRRLDERGEKIIATLRYTDAWTHLMRRTSPSYNAGARHWSIRQKSESLFAH